MPGHTNVGQHGVHIVVLERSERALGAGLRLDLVSEIFERVAQGKAGLLVVLDDEHSAPRAGLFHRHDCLVVAASAPRSRSS